MGNEREEGKKEGLGTVRQELCEAHRLLIRDHNAIPEEYFIKI